MIVCEKDCGIDCGLEVIVIINGNEMIELLYDWILGCYMMKFVFNLEIGEKIVGKNVFLNEEMV